MCLKKYELKYLKYLFCIDGLKVPLLYFNISKENWLNSLMIVFVPLCGYNGEEYNAFQICQGLSAFILVLFCFSGQSHLKLQRSLNRWKYRWKYLVEILCESAIVNNFSVGLLHSFLHFPKLKKFYLTGQNNYMTSCKIRCGQFCLYIHINRLHRMIKSHYFSLMVDCNNFSIFDIPGTKMWMNGKPSCLVVCIEGSPPPQNMVSILNCKKKKKFWPATMTSVAKLYQGCLSANCLAHWKICKGTACRLCFQKIQHYPGRIWTRDRKTIKSNYITMNLSAE